jgi:hypothetical protein
MKEQMLNILANLMSNNVNNRLTVELINGIVGGFDRSWSEIEQQSSQPQIRVIDPTKEKIANSGSGQ